MAGLAVLSSSSFLLFRLWVFVALMHMVAGGGGGSLMYGVYHQKKPKKVTGYGREDITVGMHL